MLSSLIWSTKKGSSYKGSEYQHQSGLDDGLRIILTELAKRNSNIVSKPITVLNSSTAPCNSDDDHFCCYLRLCHLCKKPLRMDKEIYMYRGDLGFCSVECRDRQIYMDEMKEIETSTQQRLTSCRQQSCRDKSGRCEIGTSLGAIHLERHRFPSQKNRVIFS